MIPVFAPTQFMPQTAAAAGVTFDPATLTGSNALSNGNLTAINSGTGESYVFSTVTGTKFYYEVVVNNDAATGSNAVGVGVADSSVSTGSYMGGDGHSASQYDFQGVYYGGSQTTTFGFTTGDNIGIAVDIPNKLFWSRRNGGNWNGSGTANPATGAGGIALTSINSPVKAAVDLRVAASNKVTAQFAAASWTYTAPSGFVHL